jgi:methyl-accepting chemotaxis protein
MKWFLNLKIGAKLIISFVLVAIIAGIIGYVGYNGLLTAQKAEDELYNDKLIPIRDLSQAQENILIIRGDLRAMLMYDDMKEREKYKKSIEENTIELEKSIDAFSKTSLDKEEQENLAKFQSVWPKLKGFINEVDKLASMKKDDEAININNGELRDKMTEARDFLGKLVDINIADAEKLDKESDKTGSSLRTEIIIFIVIGMLLAVGLGIFSSGIISKPLNRGVYMIQELAKGHLGERLKMDTKDEVGILAKTMDQFADDLQNNVVASMKRIADGDVNFQVQPKDNKDEIAPALNMTTQSLQGLVAEAKILTQAAVEGKLSTRGNAEKFKGGYKEIVDGVNKTLDAVIGPLNVAAEYVDRISKGDIPKRITDSYNGDFNEVKNNLNNCIDNVNALVSDANMLSKAAVEGKLSTRADAGKHHGDFRKIVEGVNSTLDAVIGPLNVAAEYVDRISKGDIPKKITDSYNGDFNEIKNNLNNCIDNVNSLVADANMLSKAAVEGKLSTRADANKHQGDFRKIVEGVNQTLDSVIGPLNVAAEYVDRISKGDIPKKITDSYNGDFNEIKNNLNTCIDAVNFLIADSGTLSKAAVEGKLKTRADASKHQGDFRKIVDGVNATLDAVINPLNDASEILQKVSKGNLKIRLSKEYAGDYVMLKDSINTTVDSQNNLVNDLLKRVEELTESSNNLLKISDQLATYSTELSAQTSSSAASSEQVSSNVSTVSSSAEEMAASIKEIAKNTSVAANLAKESQENASAASEVMNKLGESSQEIGNIVKTITSIAEQTNLLALNATIEAARAGESGKGFAVVANEVKELAKESAKATEDITNRIKTVQEETTRAIGVIEGIINNIKKINDVSNTIASAVEEQSVTTSEVNRNLNEASRGVASVVEVNTGISSSVSEYSKMATTLKTSSTSLQVMAKNLDEMLRRNYQI